MRPVILVTGCKGQLGFELQRALAPLATIVAVDRSRCDLGNESSIRECVRALRPTLIVNAGAYTAVDKAETDRDLAFAVNAAAPRILAEEAARVGAALIHYSTDYVFNGSKPSPYLETDEPDPLGVYGVSKLQGERDSGAVGVPHWIFRTSWVYGLHGNNFLKTMLRLAQQRDALSVVADQFGAPTSAQLIADVTAMVARDFLQERPVPFGLYHLVAAGKVNWHGYAQRAIARATEKGLGAKVAAEDIQAIPASAYPTPARRPVNSVLDCSRLEAALGIRLPDWSLSVDQTTDLLMENRTV